MEDDENFRISQRFPCGQDKRTVVRIPKEDSEMLTYLMTLAKDCQSITKTQTMVKTHLSFEQNIKKISGCVKEELQKTLAFLLGSNKDDPRITIDFAAIG